MIKKEKIEFEFEVVPKFPDSDVGWIQTKLPKSVMTRLQSYIEVARKNPNNVNEDLAGNISESLLIEDKDDWFFKTILLQLIKKFTEQYPTYAEKIIIFTENAPYCLNKFWVNFQKENEFNPPHNHAGMWSFVIWVKIPTDWREQHALPISANSNAPEASDFKFLYTSMLGEIIQYNYHLDKKLEGCMLFFPAKLLHAVNPFYNCDKERVSISGNILLDISENSMKRFRSQMKGKDDQK